MKYKLLVCFSLSKPNQAVTMRLSDFLIL